MIWLCQGKLPALGRVAPANSSAKILPQEFNSLVSDPFCGSRCPEGDSFSKLALCTASWRHCQLEAAARAVFEHVGYQEYFSKQRWLRLSLSSFWSPWSSLQPLHWFLAISLFNWFPESLHFLLKMLWPK